jgi:hypothetical protein
MGIAQFADHRREPIGTPAHQHERKTVAREKASELPPDPA